MKTKIVSLFAMLFLLIGCQKENSKEIQTVDSKVFEEKLKATENPQLIDVRTPEEFGVEHLKNAVNINWNGASFVTDAGKYDKTKPVFVYCKAGGRSSEAASKLKELGFKEIYNLDGGIMKWTGEKTSASNTERIGISATDYDKLIHSDKKVVVNFFAEWCGPCKKMEPYLLQMQEEFKGKIKIERLDADANKSMIDEMKIDGLPAILIYENGTEVWRHLGYLSEEDLRKKL